MPGQAGQSGSRVYSRSKFGVVLTIVSAVFLAVPGLSVVSTATGDPNRLAVGMMRRPPGERVVLA